MNTHYHLVIETTRIALSSGMKRLNGLMRRDSNVVSNPVRAELCDERGDWPWSRSRYELER
jgi:hypothetical protein